MILDDLVDLLVKGHRTQVLSALLALTDRERKDLGPKARRWLTHGTSMRIPAPRQALAVLATAGGTRQALLVATHLYSWDGEFVEDAVVLLKERAPSWLPNLVESLLDDEGTYNWRLVRGLVRARVVAAPDHPEYFRGTVRAVPDYYSRERVPLAQLLMGDPDLIGEHLIGMLSTEGSGRLLAYHDKFCETTHEHLRDHVPFPEGTWRQAIVTLVQEGRLDRNRVLDAVLAAPLRDWAAADLGWYVGMHDALELTVDEAAERQATYARLLAVEHGPSVKMAQRELLRLLGDPRFEPPLVLDASRATLGRNDKASVAAQLRLLEKVAKAHPEVPVADTVRIATDHPRADIREKVAKMLGRLGESEPVPERAGPFVVPPPEPRPAPDRVHAVGSADELAEVLLALIEEIDAIEMERAIDGLLRLADQRPRTADLLWARATEAEYYLDDPRIAPVVLARAWLTPRRRLRDGEWPIILGHSDFPAQAAAPGTFVGALGRRLTGVAQAVRRGPCNSVALPVSTDGSLDADVLSKRLVEVRRGHEPPEMELGVALLRVPHEERRAVAVPLPLRQAPAVARLLEGRLPAWDREVVRHQGNKWEPERRIPIFRDKQGREGDSLDGILARPRPERTLGAEVTYGEYDPRFEQTLALGAAMLPHDLGVLAAHAHPYLARDLRKDRAVCFSVFDALARARSTNGDPESSALILGLAAKDARARTAAQDALLDLAGHGVLDGTNLGQQAALLLQDGTVVGMRLSTGFSEVARASDAAVLPVLDALEQVLAVLPGRRDAGPFVELAADLADRAGRSVKLPAEFRALAEGKSASMTAKAARRLV